MAERWDEGSSPTRSESPEKKQKPQKLIQNQNFVFLPPVDFQVQYLLTVDINKFGLIVLENQPFHYINFIFKALVCLIIIRVCLRVILNVY